MQTVWIFSGTKGHFPSGVFYSEDKAKEWILRHKLSGVLTEYPIDIGVYEWAITNNFFSPKKEKEKTPEFIQKFSCAQQKHFHFEHGQID